MDQWTYSHSQLKMYRDCPRLYHDSYVLGLRQPKTANMAYGTWMLHAPIEAYVSGKHPFDQPLASADWELSWQAWWANFLAEFGGTNDYDDPVLTLKTAKRCLALYKDSPIEGEVQAVEEKQYYTFPDWIKYVSIPDFIVERRRDPIQHTAYGENAFKRFTVDLKFTTTWKVNPLLPYDDQCLGQAICSSADGFIRATFQADKKTGKVTGPRIEQHMVDPVLRDEWISETWRLCREIEALKKLPGATWGKNVGHCYAYGRSCYRMGDCKNGATYPVDKPHTA